MRNSIFFTILSFLIIMGCGSGTKIPNEAEKEVPVKKRIIKNVDQKDFKLKEVNLSKAISGSPVSAEFKFAENLPEDHQISSEYSIEYKWYVNATFIMESAENQLSAEYFKAGDLIQCKVQITDQVDVIKKISSREIEVLALPPELDLQAVTIPEVPGELDYQIIASDSTLNYEEDENNRPLSYSLVSPIGAGIRLDSETGKISWSLTAEIIEKFKNKIEIKFKVSNQFNSSVTSGIVLNFSSEMVERQNNQ